jgi:hypothetical protein
MRNPCASRGVATQRASNSPHQSDALVVGKRDSNFVLASIVKTKVCGAWRRHSPLSLLAEWLQCWHEEQMAVAERIMDAVFIRVIFG